MMTHSTLHGRHGSHGSKLGLGTLAAAPGQWDAASDGSASVLGVGASVTVLSPLAASCDQGVDDRDTGAEDSGSSQVGVELDVTVEVDTQAATVDDDSEVMGARGSDASPSRL